MIKRLIWAILLIGMLFFIFGASSQDGEASGRLSAWAADMLNRGSAGLGLTLRVTEHVIRKCAHFTEYALLGAFLLMNAVEWTGFLTTRHSRRADAAENPPSFQAGRSLRSLPAILGWVFFFGLLVAVLDEYSQTFVPGRSGAVSDALIDLAGIAAGVSVCCAALLARRGKKGNPGSLSIKRRRGTVEGSSVQSRQTHE